MTETIIRYAIVLFSLVFFWSSVVVACGFAAELRQRRKARRAATDDGPVEEPPKLRMAAVICAHNEERVIDRPIRSLLAQDYPASRFGIVVLADNCSDRTAEIARGFEGVEVLEKRTPSTGKGDVLAWGLERIRDDGYDVIAIFDADNAADPRWMSEINRVFAGGASVVTGHRMVYNPFVNLITGWYTLYWNLLNELSNRVRSFLGLSSMLTGTGFAFRLSALPAEGWHTRTFVEDLEFAFFRNLDGHRVHYAPDAVFYDEQPVSARPMLRQLNRWATGGLQMIGRYGWLWFKALFRKGSWRLFDCFVIITMGVCGLMMLVLNAVILNAGFIFWFLGVTWASALLATALSRYSIRALAGPILLFPFFTLILSCTVAYSIACPQRSWKPIPHGERKTKGKK